MTVIEPPPAPGCIFCGRSPLTKEHIWADWLEPYLPKGAEEYSVLKVRTFLDRSEFKQSVRPHDIHQWQVRCVCAGCNNGWMSQLQCEAKDVVVRLLRGEKFALTADDQRKVAAWIAMAVMAGDAGDRKARAVASSDCEFLLGTKGPPLNWRIAIGDFERGEWRGHWIRHPFRLVDELPPDGDRTVSEYNAQFVTFVTGRLFANITALPPGTQYMHVAAQPEAEQKMRQIWPPARGRIDWPPRALNGGNADAIAGAGINHLTRVHRAIARQ